MTKLILATKNLVKFISLCFLILSSILHSCKKEEVPTLTTSDVTNITGTAAICDGTIISEGSSAILVRGICWSTSPEPTIADSNTTNRSGAGTFTSNMVGLNGATVYYVRAYATNSAGTGYGNELSFSTLTTFNDYDGNVYTSVTIGMQVWMLENLKTTKYNDKTAIPLVIENVSWSRLITPGYCWYNYDIANKATYGALYNWYAVNTGKLCPTGWHVPTAAEWTTLTTYLGGESVAGAKLKETGTFHWQSPNTGATNESGFTALPGGGISNLGGFSYIGYNGNW